IDVGGLLLERLEPLDGGAEAAEERLPVGGRRRLVEEPLELARAITLARPVGDRLGDTRFPRFHVLCNRGGDVRRKALAFVRRRHASRAVLGGALRSGPVAGNRAAVL